MAKVHKNQSGFGVVEGLLVVVIVLLLGVVGYMVYNNRNKVASTTTNKTTTSNKTSTSTPPVEDPTTNWTVYTASDGKMSLRYPTTWVTASHPEFCSSGILLLGATTSSVGKCASEGFGQVAVTWQPTQTGCTDLNRDAYTVNSKETVTVSDVSGLKQTATSKETGPGLGSLPGGTKVVNYCFETGGYTYEADYTQLASYPDAVSDFNLMVTKTLQFTD